MFTKTDENWLGKLRNGWGWYDEWLKMQVKEFFLSLPTLSSIGPLLINKSFCYSPYQLLYKQE